MHEYSAGVIVRKDCKYLLLHYDAGHWDFPKGHIEKNESPEDAALRELEEETGLQGSIVPGFSHKIHYFFRRDSKVVSKDVVFFIAKVSDGKVGLSEEHKGFVWLPFEKALEKVTFRTAEEVLKKAEQWLSN